MAAPSGPDRFGRDNLTWPVSTVPVSSPGSFWPRFVREVSKERGRGGGSYVLEPVGLGRLVGL